MAIILSLFSHPPTEGHFSCLSSSALARPLWPALGLLAWKRSSRVAAEVELLGRRSGILLDCSQFPTRGLCCSLFHQRSLLSLEPPPVCAISHYRQGRTPFLMPEGRLHLFLWKCSSCLLLIFLSSLVIFFLVLKSASHMDKITLFLWYKLRMAPPQCGVYLLTLLLPLFCCVTFLDCFFVLLLLCNVLRFLSLFLSSCLDFKSCFERLPHSQL